MKLRNSILTLAVMLFSFQSLLALGTYSEGRAIVKVIKMESQGIFINSFEGEFEVASYDKSEQCDMEDGTCYTPQKKTVKFSQTGSVGAQGRAVEKMTKHELLCYEKRSLKN